VFAERPTRASRIQAYRSTITFKINPLRLCAVDFDFNRDLVKGLKSDHIERGPLSRNSEYLADGGSIAIAVLVTFRQHHVPSVALSKAWFHQDMGLGFTRQCPKQDKIHSVSKIHYMGPYRRYLKLWNIGLQCPDCLFMHFYHRVRGSILHKYAQES
jgi:hypothetical protein